MHHNLYNLASLGLITVLGVFIWIKYTKHMSSKKKKKTCTRRSLDELLSSSSWEKVGVVEKLWVYPLKSCAGMDVKEAVFEKEGPRVGNCRDRSFFIVDEKGVMITGRKITATLSISVEYDARGESFVLRTPNLAPLILRVAEIESDGIAVSSKIFNEDVRGLDCGDAVADWLALVLGRKCRLLFHGSCPSIRNTEQWTQQFSLMNDNDNPQYADTASTMLMTTASIADLSKRVSRQLPPQNFRPNILVGGITEPYDEDDWSYVKIGDAIFRVGMPCTRCVFTTIDYKTGERDNKMEPLRTLKKFRCSPGEKSPNFGVFLGVDKHGKIEQNDPVFVLRN